MNAVRIGHSGLGPLARESHPARTSGLANASRPLGEKQHCSERHCGHAVGLDWLALARRGLANVYSLHATMDTLRTAYP